MVGGKLPWAREPAVQLGGLEKVKPRFPWPSQSGAWAASEF